MAQSPAWTDYYKRQNMYPEEQFLVGFVSGVNTDNQDAMRLKSTYEVLAKDKLIQAIQVEIQTNNSLNVSNVNGQSEEAFLSKSVSFSKANVAGLSIQSYYDKKKKEVFAIAFANRKELAFYYYNLIKSGHEELKQKLTTGKTYAQKGDKENALRSFYETMPVVSQIDEARALLLALNRKMYADIHTDDINNIKLELIDEINSLQKPNDLNLSESAYFVAYGLFVQMGTVTDMLHLDVVGFENTELESRFSDRWKTEITAALVKAGNYKVRKTAGTLIVSGNYWQEGDLIKINMAVSKNKELLAVSKGSLPLSWLNHENISFIPEQIQKLYGLEGCQLSVKAFPETLKLGKPSAKAIVVQLMNMTTDGPHEQEGIPIQLTHNDHSEPLAVARCNSEGLAKLFLPAIHSNEVVYTLQVGVDLAAYLDISKTSLFYSMAMRQNPVADLALDLKTQKPTICFHSREEAQGRTMEITTIEPVLKEVLAESGYHFVDTDSQADYIINIHGNTSTTSKQDGLCFAYLDVNLSVVDVARNEEIYKTHINQIKGGSSNMDKPARKAYQQAAESLKERIMESPLAVSSMVD